MQIYCSILPFTPHNTALSRTYKSLHPSDVNVIAGLEATWNAAIADDTNLVTSVEFSSDGSRLATASLDKIVRLWDGRTGNCIATLEGHSKRIKLVTFSSDGSTLASASQDGTIRLWDGRTGVCIATLDGHSRGVKLVTMSWDGSRLASASFGGIIRLWDGRTGNHIATLGEYVRQVSNMKFSSDGSTLAASAGTGTGMLWDGKTGIHITYFRGHPDHPVTFSPDASRLAFPSSDESVQLQDGRTGDHVATFAFQYTIDRVITFSPDNLKLAVRAYSPSNKAVVLLCDDRAGGHITTLEGDDGDVKTVMFLGNGTRIVVAYSYSLLLWDITAANKPLVLFRNAAFDTFLSSKRNCLFLLEKRRDLDLWGLTVVNLASSSPLNTQVICWFPPHVSPDSFVMHPDGSMAAVLCCNGRLLLLDVSKFSISP